MNPENRQNQNEGDLNTKENQEPQPESAPEGIEDFQELMEQRIQAAEAEVKEITDSGGQAAEHANDSIGLSGEKAEAIRKSEGVDEGIQETQRLAQEALDEFKKKAEAIFAHGFNLAVMHGAGEINIDMQGYNTDQKIAVANIVSKNSERLQVGGKLPMTVNMNMGKMSQEDIQRFTEGHKNSPETQSLLAKLAAEKRIQEEQRRVQEEQRIEPDKGEEMRRERAELIAQARERRRISNEKQDKEPGKCPKCGAETSSADNFCGKCGGRLNEQVGEGNAVSEKKVESVPGKGAEPQEQQIAPGKGAEMSIAKEKNIGRQDLFDELDKIKGMPGTIKFYTSQELKKLVSSVLDSRDPRRLLEITRTGGLRKKVTDIFQSENRRDAA